jgi:hypothetical protein
MRGRRSTITTRKTPRSSRRTGRALGAIALIALSSVGLGAMSASADRGAKDGPGKLAGAWLVSVDRTGLPALKSLQTYTKGGGVVETSNGGAGARSAAHGAWERTGARTYAVTMVFFRYDPAGGAYLGTVKLRREIEIAPDGESFTGVSVGELRDPAGNLLPGSNTRRDIERGQRIHVEPIPAQP